MPGHFGTNFAFCKILAKGLAKKAENSPFFVLTFGLTFVTLAMLGLIELMFSKVL